MIEPLHLVLLAFFGAYCLVPALLGVVLVSRLGVNWAFWCGVLSCVVPFLVGVNVVFLGHNQLIFGVLVACGCVVSCVFAYCEARSFGDRIPPRPIAVALAVVYSLLLLWFVVAPYIFFRVVKEIRIFGVPPLLSSMGNRPLLSAPSREGAPGWKDIKDEDED
jgi:hypothetical protein